MQPAIRERLERCSSLPSLPSVAIRVLELCQQDNLDLNQIAGVIGNDPALAAKLVRTANSPLFATRREITTIANAVGLLGVNAVRTLVLSFSLVRDGQAKGQADLGAYWQRSLLSALAARELTKGNPDEAFLAGLLQDIGMLAMARSLGADYAKVLTEAGGDHDRLVELERAAFDADHAEIGAWLLERWRAPKLLAEVVKASHEPESIAAGGLRNLAEVVSLAGRFADQWTGVKELAPARLRRDVAERWPEGAVDVDGVNKRLIERGPLLAPIFEVKLDAHEMNDVLEQAHEVMLSLSVRASQEVQHIHEALARLESRTAALLAEAQRDPLTGVANRGYTNAYLDEVFSAAVEASRTIGVLFADVDHFKRVNDTLGHAAGDAVLQSVAQRLTSSLRGGDFVGRYGGEEFVIILRTENAAELTLVAERIRQSVAEAPHAAGGGQTLAVTISLGCSLLDRARHRLPSDLLAEADAALYQAKRSGRNRIELSAGAMAQV